MKKRAVVVAGIDGITTIKTGVGRVVSDLIDALCIINKSDEIPLTKFDLFAVGPSIDEASIDCSETQQKEIDEVCTRNGGKMGRFHVHGPASSLDDIWAVRHPERWQGLCSECAALIVEFCGAYSEIVIFVNGSPLFGLRDYLSKKHRIILVPHSLWRVFAETERFDAQVQFEQRAFNNTVRDEGDFIACVSTYMRNEFLRRYELPKEKLLLMENGLILEKYAKKIDGVSPDQYIEKCGIDLSTDVIFSWGRCDKVKGFDIIIKAFRHIVKKFPNIKLVILSPVGFSGESAFDEISRLVRYIPENAVKILFHFDEILPLLLISSPATKAVVLASRSEASAIVALETKAFGHGGLPVIYSDIPAFVDAFKDDPAAFRFISEDVEDLDRVVSEVLRRKITRVNISSSYVDNVRACLASILN